MTAAKVLKENLSSRAVPHTSIPWQPEQKRDPHCVTYGDGSSRWQESQHAGQPGKVKKQPMALFQAIQVSCSCASSWRRGGSLGLGGWEGILLWSQMRFRKEETKTGHCLHLQQMPWNAPQLSQLYTFYSASNLCLLLSPDTVGHLRRCSRWLCVAIVPLPAGRVIFLTSFFFHPKMILYQKYWDFILQKSIR